MENDFIDKHSFCCEHCGFCCTLDVVVIDEDVERIRRRIKDSKEPFVVERDGLIVLKSKDGLCLFYDIDKKCCGIYEDRPGVCRRFPYNNPIMSPRCTQRKDFSSKIERSMLLMVEQERRKKALG